MRRPTTSAIGFLVACGAGVFTWSLMSGTNSLALLKSEESLEESLLDQTPFGTSQSVVLQNLRERDFRIVAHDASQGVLTRSGTIVGAQHVKAILGEFSLEPFPLTVVLSAAFGFDEKGTLIAVEVRRTYDGP